MEKSLTSTPEETKDLTEKFQMLNLENYRAEKL
jgi:hypothetical protein